MPREGEGGRPIAVRPERKLDITIGLLIALLTAFLTGAWHVATWKASTDIRLTTLERERCPCRDMYQRVPASEPNR